MLILRFLPGNSSFVPLKEHPDKTPRASTGKRNKGIISELFRAPHKGWWELVDLGCLEIRAHGIKAVVLQSDPSARNHSCSAMRSRRVVLKND